MEQDWLRPQLRGASGPNITDWQQPQLRSNPIPQPTLKRKADAQQGQAHWPAKAKTGKPLDVPQPALKRKADTLGQAPRPAKAKPVKPWDDGLQPTLRCSPCKPQLTSHHRQNQSDITAELELGAVLLAGAGCQAQPDTYAKHGMDPERISASLEMCKAKGLHHCGRRKQAMSGLPTLLHYVMKRSVGHTPICSRFQSFVASGPSLGQWVTLLCGG